ncbi:MAG TPA: pilin [Candidatus Paceibacterota bacterium]
MKISTKINSMKINSLSAILVILILFVVFPYTASAACPQGYIERDGTCWLQDINVEGQNDPGPDAEGSNRGCPANTICIDNPVSGEDTLEGFINLIIRNIIMPVGGVIAVVFIIYSGFLFATARGSEEKIKTAKRAFLYAVIGALILLGAMVISEAIKGTIDQIRT